MNKSVKKNNFGIAVGIAVSFIFLIIFLLGIFLITQAGKDSNQLTFDEKIAYITKKNEYIEFNEENGIIYVNDEIIVVSKEDAQIDDIRNLAIEQGATIDEDMADIGIYRFIYSEPMSYEDINTKIEALKQNALVDDAYYNIVSLDESDTGEDTSSEFREPVYPKDTWNRDSWNTSIPRGANWGMEAIDAPGAWAYLDEASTINIGLIDAFPNTSHPDLQNMFDNSSNIFIDKKTNSTSINSFDIQPHDHGSHVSGIMNAETEWTDKNMSNKYTGFFSFFSYLWNKLFSWNKDTGVSGVMGNKGRLYYSRSYYVNNGKVSFGFNTDFTYLQSLKLLIDQDVQVINISQNTSRLIGFAASRGNQNAINYLTEQANFADKALSRLISKREAEGKSDFVICVAAGNNNHLYYYKNDSEPYGYREKEDDTVKTASDIQVDTGNALALYNNFLNMMSTPAVKERIIVVGSIGINNEKSTTTNTIYKYSDFSNVGDRVDIVAPGERIYSCINNGYKSLSGTSMATPHVSGVAGLVFACNPGISGPDVKNILIQSTNGTYYYNGGHSGLLNAKMAVVNALAGTNKAIPDKIIKKAPTGTTSSSKKGLDVCFVVDTTGSMDDDIDNAKENMSNILDVLSQKTSDYRVALIDYRDYSSRTGYSYDYPYKVQLSFTNNNEQIKNSIYSLDLGNGGDNEETVYSALIESSKLDWREDAKKVIIILGDAAPLDPEPETGYTYQDVSAALYASDIALDYDESDTRVTDFIDKDLINVYSIGTNASDEASDFFREISEDTGGNFLSIDDASEVSDAIIDSIEQIDITNLVPVSIDFGQSLSIKNIDIYMDDIYQFTIRTDNSGKFQFDGIEPGTYNWKFKSRSGVLDITGTEDSILADPTPSKHTSSPF